MDKRTALRRFTIVGFIGFTLMVVGAFIRQEWIADAARDQVAHTYQVRVQIDQVYTRIKEMEVGQRGFALS